MVDVYNSTVSGMDILASVSPGMGWLIAVLVFFGILFTIFMLSRNFRAFLYGAVTTGVLGGIGFFSRYVGKSAEEGNSVPWQWTAGVIGFILVSIVVGRLVRLLPFMKSFEKSMEEK